MIIKKPINLDLTINSGQTSQPPWIFDAKSYSNAIIVDEKPLIFNVRQSGDYLDFNLDDEKAISRLKYIFDLDFDLAKFYKFMNNYDELKDMSGFCRGMRLFLAPDPFECVISSICSANNSIKRWTRSVLQIKENWGERCGDYYTFPQSSDLSKVYLDGEDEFNSSGVQDISSCSNNLKSCGVGYRAAYMRRASEMFCGEIDIGEIFKMSYDEAFETVNKVPGVGPKVADCILLYGFNFKEAFPTDVWIKRIVSYLYFDGADIPVSKIREFGMDEFGEYAGYVQLYMFHYARKSGLMEKLKTGK